MIAAQRFTGIIDGEEKCFRPGDTITAAEANEMALAEKPHLVKIEANSAKSAKA